MHAPAQSSSTYHCIVPSCSFFLFTSYVNATLGEHSGSCFLIARNLDKITTCVLFFRSFSLVLRLLRATCNHQHFSLAVPTSNSSCTRGICECVLFNCRSSFAAHILSFVHFFPLFRLVPTSSIYCKTCHFFIFCNVLRSTEEPRRKRRRSTANT